MIIFTKMLGVFERLYVLNDEHFEKYLPLRNT